jgi:serine protease Do
MSQRPRLALGLAFTIVALAGLILGFALAARFRPPTDAFAGSGGPLPVTVPPVGNAPAIGAAPVPSSFVGLAKAVGPAVVNIEVKIGRQSRGADPFGFGGGGGGVAQGQGTGFLVSADGFILTNDHVVGSASDIRVTLADGRELAGKVVGTDPRTDIALIKVEDKRPFPTVKLGDSDGVEIGEWVVAIGNPFGLDHTVTAGIVSAKGRKNVRPGGGRRQGYYDFIQTDASINPGNSGGPLINTRGEVIGINAAINAQGQGIGFAIPVNMAKTLLPLLQQHGRVARSWLGVNIQPVTKELAKSLSLADTAGALVAGVVPGSPAEKAGLKPGDVIVGFEGKNILSSDELPWLASTAGIGKTVELQITSGKSQPRRVQVKLEEMPDEDAVARAPTGTPRGAPSARLGLSVTPVTPQLARQLEMDRAVGVVITNVDESSPAATVLAPGDVIVSVYDRPVTSGADLDSLTAKLGSGEVLRMLVIREGTPMWLAFTLP